MIIPTNKPVNPFAGGQHIVKATERLTAGHPFFELEPLLGEGPFDTPPAVLAILQNPEDGLGEYCDDFLGSLGLFLKAHQDIGYDRDQTLSAAKDVLLRLNILLEEYPPTNLDVHKVRLDVLKAALPLLDPQVYDPRILFTPLNSATAFFIFVGLFTSVLQKDFGLLYEDDKCYVYKRGAEDEKARFDVYLFARGKDLIRRLHSASGADWEDKFLEEANKSSITLSWL